MSSFVDDVDVDNAEQPELVEAREVVDVDLPEPESSVEVELHGATGAPGVELGIIPPEAEMRALVQLAVTLSAAQLVPKALKDSPNDVLLVLLTARDLGIKVTTALRLCYPIDGQVTVAPKLKLAIIRERGIGRVWPDPANDATQATWYAVRDDDPDTTFQQTYTIEDAKRANLTGKDNWRNYPARMLSWRACGYLMDEAFGEVGTGLYSPDELGALTDEDGHVILDVTEVGPLEGTTEPRSMAAARRRAEQGPPPMASEVVRAVLADMITTLPEEGRAAAVELWRSAVGVKLDDLPEAKVKAARAVCDSIWKRAQSGEWGDWSPTFDPDEALSAAESAGAPESGDGAAEPTETLSEPQSGQSGDAEPTDEETIDSIIDEVAEMPLDDVAAELDRLDVELAAGADEKELRRTLAVRRAHDAGLL